MNSPLLFKTTAFLFATLCLTVSVCPASGAQTNTTWQPWRTARNQGINALFCYLRVHNAKVEYSDLVEGLAKETTGGPYSGNTLVRLAAKHDVAMRVTSFTMKEFATCERPLIVYMTSDKPDDGVFLLVLNSTKDRVVFMAGSNGAVYSMSMEDFRRTWSGIALLQSKGQTQNWILFGVGLTAALPLCVGIRGYLTKKK